MTAWLISANVGLADINTAFGGPANVNTPPSVGRNRGGGPQYAVPEWWHLCGLWAFVCRWGGVLGAELGSTPATK